MNGAQQKVSAQAKQKAVALKVYQQGIDLQRQTGFESKIYTTVEKMLKAKVNLEEGLVQCWQAQSQRHADLSQKPISDFVLV